MATIPIVKFAVEEINYFIKYMVDHIAEYGLSELTNNYMGDIPSIQNCHPLALEYGNMLNADEQGNYTSILPAIGVELTSDDEAGQQFLGSGNRNEEITQDFINNESAIDIKNRFSQGSILSKTNLTNLQAMKTAKGTDKLWSKKMSYLEDVQLAISIWSDHWEITRILYVVVRDLLKRIKHDISKDGVKNLKIKGTGAIYNFEFNTTLYGGEFTITFINTHHQIIVDDSLDTIKSVEESIKSPYPESKPIFKSIGG